MMKSIKLFFAIVFVFAGLNLSAQNSKPATKIEALKVSGNCSMCKDRIEKAVKEAGATSAYWDAKTNMLKVSYDPSKTNTDSLLKKVASVGHDNERYKAEDKVYNALPGCCKYDRSGVLTGKVNH